MSSRSTNPDRPSDLKLLKSLKTFFKRRHKILLAFLFGSFASNCSRPSSDVDIGILFETVPDIYVINGLTEELSSILPREADLVVLNHASPVLKMQILKNGILIYSSNKKYFHQFFADTVNQYDDLKRIRKNCEENILKGRIYAG
jgi:predicted nucleotidyltransferase